MCILCTVNSYIADNRFGLIDYVVSFAVLLAAHLRNDISSHTID